MSRHHKRWFTLKQESISTAASVFKMINLNGDYSPRRQSIVPVNQGFFERPSRQVLGRVPRLSLGIVLPCEIPPITLALAGPLALEAYEVLPLLLACSKQGSGRSESSVEGTLEPQSRQLRLEPTDLPFRWATHRLRGIETPLALLQVEVEVGKQLGSIFLGGRTRSSLMAGIPENRRQPPVPKIFFGLI
jgi:hypothetical protein